MLKPNNLYPKDIALDVNDGIRFSWNAQGEPQTGFNVFVYDNSDDALILDTGQVTSTNEYYEFSNGLSLAGEEWEEVADIESLYDFQMSQIKYLGNGVCIAGMCMDTEYAYFLRSTDYGENWSQLYLANAYELYGFANNGSVVVCFARMNSSPYYRFYRSTDRGETWTYTDDFNSLNKHTIMPYGWVFPNISYVGNNSFIAPCDDSEIFVSTDNGVTFSSLGSVAGITEDLTGSTNVGNGICLVSSETHILKSTTYGQTWTDTGSHTPSEITTVEYIDGDIVLAGVLETDYPILYSDDKGSTWSKLNVSGIDIVKSFAYIGNGKVIAIAMDSTPNTKVLRSDDYGFTWEVLTTDLTTNDISSIEYTNSFLVAGESTRTTSNKIYYNTDVSTISNGNEYKWYVKTYSSTGNADSNFEFFKTSSTPIVEFTDPIFYSPTPIGGTPVEPTPIILDTQDYTFECSYYQAESVYAKRFKFNLYSSDANTLIDTSDWVYDFNISYEFTGMENGLIYYIECIVQTQDDVQTTTGKNSFSIAFSPPSTTNSLLLTENNYDGNITTDWGDQTRILGIASETQSYVTGYYGEALDLSDGETVTYNVDFEINSNSIYGRIKFQSGFDGAILTLDGTVNFGYDLATQKFYWQDSDTTYSDSVTIDTSSWYIFGISNGGNETYPTQIVVGKLVSDTIQVVTTIDVASSSLL